jgi:hypothetical protein
MAGHLAVKIEVTTFVRLFSRHNRMSFCCKDLAIPGNIARRAVKLDVKVMGKRTKKQRTKNQETEKLQNLKLVNPKP